METRALVVALIAILNFAVETLEKLVAEDGGDDKNNKGSRTRVKAKGKAKDDDDDDDDVSEDDLVDAVRAAQKVLDAKDVKAIIKKHGKAERATLVKAQYRGAVIEALEEAMEAED